MQEIIERLKDILSNEIEGKVYDKDVASALGISKESLSHLKKRGSVPYEQISKFCAKRDISINWVLFGQVPKSLEEETRRYIKIKYFSSINASAGGGGINYEENYEYITLDRLFLETIYKNISSNSSDIAALNIIGDSMEPTLYDREIIILDKSILDFQKGGIFVISTDAGLFVKRVSMRLDGALDLISDNKNYNSEILRDDELSNIKIVGKVVGKIAPV